MPTPEETKSARERLAALRKRVRARQESVIADNAELSPGPVAGVIDSLAQGLSIGTADELEAFGRSFSSANNPFPGASFRDRFDNILFDLEQRRRGFRAENPGLSFGSELAGGITGGVGLVRGGRAIAPNLSARVGRLPFIPRLAAVGGAEGAAFGAASSIPGERLEGAAFGGAFGAGGGPLFGTGFAIAGQAVRPVVQKLIDSFTEGPRSKAVKLVTQSLERDEITPQEASTILRQMGPRGTLADIGENTTDLARTAMSIPNQGRNRGRLFLDERQDTQRLQLVQAARRAGRADEFDEQVINAINRAESSAAPLYREAYSQVLDVTPQMAELLKRPAMQKAMLKAARKVRDLGFSDEIINDVTDVRFMDLVKRALDDDIGIAQRQGRRDDVGILQGIKRQFLDEIDSQVPVYAEARSAFAGEAAIRDASDFGRRVFNNRTPTSEIAEQVQNMGESELQGFRQGLLTSISDNLDNVLSTSNAAKRFASMPRLREVLRLAFPDQNELQRFLQTAANESRFSETRNALLGGSPTARIQASQRAAAGESGVLEGITDVLTGGTAAFVRGLRNSIFRQDIEPETADEILRILLDPSVIPNNLRVPLPQRAGNFIVPRLNRTDFPGAVAGGLGSLQIDPDRSEPRSIEEIIERQNRLFQ